MLAGSSPLDILSLSSPGVTHFSCPLLEFGNISMKASIEPNALPVWACMHGGEIHLWAVE